MKRSLLLLAVVAGLGLCAYQGRPVTAADKADAPFVHCVIFYLKKDAPKDEPKALADDATALLAKIPTVRMVKIGPPSDKSTPKVGVTDYQVGLLVLFDDAAGLKTYLDHPLHLKYVEKHEKHIDKVLVYDFVNTAK
jgi:hypothetical protein